jgi:hypothetical protein
MAAAAAKPISTVVQKRRTLSAETGAPSARARGANSANMRGAE